MSDSLSRPSAPVQSGIPEERESVIRAKELVEDLVRKSAEEVAGRRRVRRSEESEESGEGSLRGSGVARGGGPERAEARESGLGRSEARETTQHGLRPTNMGQPAPNPPTLPRPTKQFGRRGSPSPLRRGAGLRRDRGEKPDRDAALPVEAVPLRERLAGKMVVLRLDSVIVLEDRNIRGPVDLSGDDHREMVESIRAVGLIEPPVVRRGTWKGEERVILVSGHRRFAALSELKCEECVFYEVDLTEREADVVNAAENTSKRDVPTWRVAQALARYRTEYKMSLRAIGDHVGLSHSYVGELLQLEMCLCPRLLRIFRGEQAGDKGGATFSVLLKLARLEQSEQWGAWRDVVEERARLARGEDAPRGRTLARAVRVLSRGKLERFLVETDRAERCRGKRAELTDEDRAMLRSALRYVLGIDAASPLSRSGKPR